MKRLRKRLVDELCEYSEGKSYVASLCAEAADRIKRQDERIVMLRKMLQRARMKSNPQTITRAHCQNPKRTSIPFQEP